MEWAYDIGGIGRTVNAWVCLARDAKRERPNNVDLSECACDQGHGRSYN